MVSSFVRALGRRYAAQERWAPFEHVRMWGAPVALPAACRCDRRLTEPHSEPTCPYIDPDSWYAAEVERMRERAPA